MTGPTPAEKLRHAWCACCGGAPDRAIVGKVDGFPRCNVCADEKRGLEDWNPRTRGRSAIRADGNAANAINNPDGWDAWVRLSESWGHP
jgi:hypothetical protein